MSEWKKYKLGQIAEIVGGGTPDTSKKEYWEGEIPWLTPRDLTRYRKIYVNRGVRTITAEGLKNSSAKILPKGTVLLTSRAPIGYVAIAQNEICTNQGFKSLILDANLAHNEFIYFWLKNNVVYLQSIGAGTTFAEISGSALKEVSLVIPSFSEQKSIASILTCLDNKIDLLHRQNATLEKMAETLFRQWFVEEVKEEWETSKLIKEFDFTMGLSPPGESYNEEMIGIPMFQGNADFGFRYPINRIFTTDPKRLAEKGDTLISVRAPVGEQNMAREKCCIGRGVAAFRYKFDSSFYSYTYYKMRSLMSDIKQFNETGTVFGSINKNDFEEIDIIIPDKQTVVKFQNKVKFFDEKIYLNQNQIDLITIIRDTLLPKLMSGELRVNYEN